MIEKEKTKAKVKFKRNMCSFFLILASLTAVLLSSCTSSIPPEAENGILNCKNIESDRPIDLDGTWEFIWNEHIDPNEVFSDTNKKKWRRIKFPAYWNNLEYDGIKLTGKGIATYHLKINCPQYKNRILSMRFRFIAPAFRVFVNGEKKLTVGSPGKTVENYRDGRFTHQIFFKSPKETIEVVMHISNFTYYEGGIYRSISFGPAQELTFEKTKQSALELFVVGCILIIAIYHISLFVFRKKEIGSFYFGLFCLAIAFYSILVNEVFISYLIPDITSRIVTLLNSLMFFIFLPTFALFIGSIFKEEFSINVLKIIIVLSILFTTQIFLAPGMNYLYSIPYYHGITLIYGVYAVISLVRAVKHQREGAVIILIGALILFAVTINDILHNRRIIQTADLIPFGLLAFILLQSLALSIRFSNAYVNVEKLSTALSDTNEELRLLNINLENKVKDRTNMLESAMEELEVINTNLMETNRELEQAKLIMDTDMEMAINVQRVFFPDKAPLVKDWDIAYYFRPMAGVSGDFYDFYINNDDLKGIALFDVVGHGIASGLITMIAKSALYKIFLNFPNESLGKILEIFNDELIEDIGDTYNFITGILLRVSENNIEYANAGHLEPILKQGSEVLTIDDKKNNIKGGYLGIPILKGTYGSISLSMSSGDTLALFTDGLIETRSSTNGILEMKSLLDIMKNSESEDTAFDVCDRYVKLYNEHIKDSKHNDDLTIIILKRK